MVETSQGGRHGLIIDGRTNTISATKLYIIAIQGVRVWIRNGIAAVKNPEFVSFYGLEVDFPQYESVRIDAGQRYYFTDTMINQSYERTNIAIGTSNPTSVKTVTFHGGFCTSAYYSGIDIQGTCVCIQGMNILANNRIGTAAGIEVYAPAQNVTIAGNTLGDQDNITQLYGVRVWDSVDIFSITGNSAWYNAYAGIRVVPGLSGGRREVVANTGYTVL